MMNFTDHQFKKQIKNRKLATKRSVQTLTQKMINEFCEKRTKLQSR